MSNALTDSMTQLHATLSTLGNSVSACQQQVTKINETPMFETMTRALWTVEQERKDDEQRSNYVIISGLELEQGGNDKDMVSSICENHLPIKSQIKTNDLSLFLSTYDSDIFSVIETWLTPNDPDNLFLPPGFSFVRRDRGSRGGGVAFIIKNTVSYKVVSVPSIYSHIEIVSIDVPTSTKNYRLISYYRSGGFDVSAEPYAFDSVGCIKELCKGGVVCLMGDFNLSPINWVN
ncbi:hypothetical protein HELRODRAFT_164968 [Helobdella robusta]|uniref:Endonuclease/exonuclease/phosphatase domain-containing protein n=1 Tax=Helobdella robusta TaxID=6412 RepID=T1EW12_HELRO|nr:hypothetical protein HELRODRAFT_164968 [Helobdella robusta]ESN92837.1 hypothetical protein HELRODRAFT_164968 [Helobdella robusta]